jgi:hypothetical protein
MAIKKKHKGTCTQSKRLHSSFTEEKGMPVKGDIGPPILPKAERDKLLTADGGSWLKTDKVQRQKLKASKWVAPSAVKVSAKEKAEQRAHNKAVVDQITDTERGEGHAKKRNPQIAPTKALVSYRYQPEFLHTAKVRTTVTGKKGVQLYATVEVPVFSTSNPAAIAISRSHGGNVSSPVSTATPYFKGKNGAANLKVRKNPKAKFTWQDRIEMTHSVAITGKATVHPRTEVTRHDVDALRPVRAKAKALARSMKAFANVEKRKQAKLAKRAGMTHSPGPVVMKTPKKVVTAEMHLENKRAAVIATKLHRAECMSNTLRHKTAWMERSSPVAA